VTAVAGVTSKHSSWSVEETVARLQAAIAAAGGKVFAVIDQQAEAAAAGLALRETRLVIFGNPRAGTAVMEAAPLAALELPLKILVWQDGERTTVSYTDPSILAARYGLGPELAKILSATEVVAGAALER
jgi:uncharacterized protein (DUF302 family)